MINQPDNGLSLLTTHRLVHRNGEFLLMDTLRDRITAIVPRLVTLLLMRRYGIMNECLHPTIFEICLQLITAFTENGELMIDVVLIAEPLRQGDQRIVDGLVIVGCQLLALLIVLVEIFQLHIEDGSIQL